MLQFATIDQFYDFQGLTRVKPTDPDLIEAYDAETKRLDALLRRASARVKAAVRLAAGVSYDRTTGIPVRATIAQGFADATCAQAVWFEENGDPSGALDKFDSVGLLGVSFARRASSSGTDGGAAASRVAPESLEILSNLGIFTTRVRH